MCSHAAVALSGMLQRTERDDHHTPTEQKPSNQQKKFYRSLVATRTLSGIMELRQHASATANPHRTCAQPGRTSGRMEAADDWRVRETRRGKGRDTAAAGAVQGLRGCGP
jgi:hypothetical protein